MVENEFGKRGKAKSLCSLLTTKGLLKCIITDKDTLAGNDIYDHINFSQWSYDCIS